jgi:hypothetical protein
MRRIRLGVLATFLAGLRRCGLSTSFPDDYVSTGDRADRRLNFHPDSMQRNVLGKPRA